MFFGSKHPKKQKNAKTLVLPPTKHRHSQTPRRFGPPRPQACILRGRGLRRIIMWGRAQFLLFFKLLPKLTNKNLQTNNQTKSPLSCTSSLVDPIQYVFRSLQKKKTKICSSQKNCLLDFSHHIVTSAKGFQQRNTSFSTSLRPNKPKNI